MSMFLINIYNKILNPLSVFITLILAVPVFWTWWEVVFGRRRRRKQWVKEVTNTPALRPAILIIDLKPDVDIKTQVIRFSQKDSLLKSVPDDRIFHILHKKRIKPDDMGRFVETLRKKLAVMVEAGSDTVYLFYAGPVTPAAVIGAELSNCFQVILFQHNQGNYINMGPLEYCDS